MTYMKKITKYPDGKKIADQIAKEWKVIYRRRPAMMDELKKAGFQNDLCIVLCVKLG